MKKTVKKSIALCIFICLIFVIMLSSFAYNKIDSRHDDNRIVELENKQNLSSTMDTLKTYSWFRSFIDWSNSDGFFATIIKNVVNFFTPKITITFVCNGGDDLDPIVLRKRVDILPPHMAPVPERENYIFMGWYEDENLTKPYQNYGILKESNTLYAKWEACE